MQENIALVIHSVATTGNINDLLAMGERFVNLGVKVWRILRLAYANDKPKMQKELGYSEDKYLYFYKIIKRKSVNDWNSRMQVIIQQYNERERNSVILVSPNGNFHTESPFHAARKILIDLNNPRNLNNEFLIKKINWWAHYDRYINFEQEGK